MGYFYASDYNGYGLVLVLWEIDLTKEVLMSVFAHIDQVVATVLLTSILLYWFTLVSYNSSWNGKY